MILYSTTLGANAPRDREPEIRLVISNYRAIYLLIAAYFCPYFSSSLHCFLSHSFSFSSLYFLFTRFLSVFQSISYVSFFASVCDVCVGISFRLMSRNKFFISIFDLDLKEAVRIRQNKEEYAEMTKMILQLPPRHETQNKLEQLHLDLRGYCINVFTRNFLTSLITRRLT